MTEAPILTALFFGFLLGVKHALDADHIVAVTTIVSRSSSLLRSTLVGLSWGVGHTFTLFAAGFMVLVFKLTIPDKLALSMEFVVGIFLVLLGVPLVKQLLASRFWKWAGFIRPPRPARHVALYVNHYHLMSAGGRANAEPPMTGTSMRQSTLLMRRRGTSSLIVEAE